MKRILILLLVLLPVGLFAQSGEVASVWEELFGKYFLSTAVFAAAVIALTSILEKYVLFLKALPSQIKSFIAGIGLGALGYFANLGIFADATVFEAIGIVVTTTLGANGIFDFLFKTLGKKDEVTDEVIK